MTAITTLSPAPDTRAPGRPPPPRARDPFFDNAKFLLVVLVVVGHNWAPLVRDMATAKAAYTVVYLFHMPAFILLCGLFSRGFTGTGPQIRALITRVLVPYLVFTAAYKGLYAVISGAEFTLKPAEPTFLLWFLMALFLWRITSPVWRAVRYPVAVAVVISLAAGLTGINAQVALPRVLMFLPWFVLGLQLRPEHFHRLRTPAVRRSAPFVLLAALATAYVLAPRINANWLYMTANNDMLHTPMLGYLGIRLLIFAATGVLTAAFFALVPSRRTAYTALGAATMFPFLLHGLLVQTGKEYGLFEELAGLGAPALVLIAGCGAALTVLLSCAPVRRVLRPVVEPRFPKGLVPADGTSRDTTPARNAGTAREAAAPDGNTR